MVSAITDKKPPCFERDPLLCAVDNDDDDDDDDDDEDDDEEDVDEDGSEAINWHWTFANSNG